MLSGGVRTASSMSRQKRQGRQKLVVWRFETTPAAWLVREGSTKDSIAVGDHGNRRRIPSSGQPYAWLGKVTQADGTRLRPNGRPLP